MRLGTRGSRGWVALIGLPACLYDADDRCGKHQKYQDEMCVCDEGYALRESACVEIVVPDAAGQQDAGESDADAGAQTATGQREPCMSPADCAGFDANYCNVFLGVCQVQGCTDTSCDPGFLCIDLGMYIAGEPTVCLHPEDAPQ